MPSLVVKLPILLGGLYVCQVGVAGIDEAIKPFVVHFLGAGEHPYAVGRVGVLCEEVLCTGGQRSESCGSLSANP